MFLSGNSFYLLFDSAFCSFSFVFIVSRLFIFFRYHSFSPFLQLPFHFVVYTATIISYYHFCSFHFVFLHSVSHLIWAWFSFLVSFYVFLPFTAAACTDLGTAAIRFRTPCVAFRSTCRFRCFLLVFVLLRFLPPLAVISSAVLFVHRSSCHFLTAISTCLRFAAFLPFSYRRLLEYTQFVLVMHSFCAFSAAYRPPPFSPCCTVSPGSAGFFLRFVFVPLRLPLVSTSLLRFSAP